MSRILTSFILLVIGISAVSAKPHSEYYYQRVALFEKLPTSEDDIIFIGNSITNGCEWCELFDNPKIKNRGINGDTSLGVRDRMTSTLKGKPSKVFLMIGVNDIANGASPDSVINVMRDILDIAIKHTPHTKIYVQSILPINDSYNIFWGHMDKSEQIRVYNSMLKDLCKEKNIPFIDLYSKFKNEYNDRMNLRYTNDGLHLMADGYLLWKEIVEPYVNE